MTDRMQISGIADLKCTPRDETREASRALPLAFEERVSRILYCLTRRARITTAQCGGRDYPDSTRPRAGWTHEWHHCPLRRDAAFRSLAPSARQPSSSPSLSPPLPLPLPLSHTHIPSLSTSSILFARTFFILLCFRKHLRPQLRRSPDQEHPFLIYRAYAWIKARSRDEDNDFDALLIKGTLFWLIREAPNYPLSGLFAIEFIENWSRTEGREALLFDCLSWPFL
ncbi:hypothetical protein IWZ00DRAFT_518203 [Phyllosticta capitalensis]